MLSLRPFIKDMFIRVTHFIGRVSRRFYFEDYVRVYPGQWVYTRFGRKRQAQKNDLNNYLNHRKFYHFATQFVRGKSVVDVGCGSGYGCEILSQAGAEKVVGCDISGYALRFARHRYGGIAQFKKLGITDLKAFADSSFDVTISSEVLEHIKEYQQEDRAIKELKRITRKGGIIVIGTPNSEMLGEHGFSFDEIKKLFAANFKSFCLFENALLPFGENRLTWKERLKTGQTGVIISQRIDLSETVLPEDTGAELKSGLEPGYYQFGHNNINTKLLHNTHSWIIVAIK
ncbi:class I SAM-dependent methyltransferase [candidate division KSB1 bacterium]|nr:class I SAM-dependent methyltransferase [candidate division KSB1 bacterium]